MIKIAVIGLVAVIVASVLPSGVLAKERKIMQAGVRVMGELNGTTLNAKLIQVISPNIMPASGKGTVTAVSNDNITLQTKNNSTITVKTNADTKVVKNGQVVGTGTAAITIGSKVKFFGLWDKALDLYTALIIRIK